MPDLNVKVSSWSFQQFDGSNFSTVGVDLSTNVGKGSLGVYAGVGTTFNSNSTGGIFDFKGSMPLDDSGFSMGFRLRENTSSETLQVRAMPMTFSAPVGQKGKVYITPYAQANINHNTGDFKTAFGAYGGGSIKLGNVTLSAELQAYDLGNINKNTLSGNVGASIPIFKN